MCSAYLENMSDLVHTTIAVARVGIFLTNFSGYKFSKRTEDEASIRKWLMTKLDSAHQNGIKALEFSHSKSNNELSKVIKGILANIENPEDYVISVKNPNVTPQAFIFGANLEDNYRKSINITISEFIRSGKSRELGLLWNKLIN